jgi:hypothetical protein
MVCHSYRKLHQDLDLFGMHSTNLWIIIVCSIMNRDRSFLGLMEAGKVTVLSCFPTPDHGIVIGWQVT